MSKVERVSVPDASSECAFEFEGNSSSLKRTHTQSSRNTNTFSRSKKRKLAAVQSAFCSSRTQKTFSSNTASSSCVESETERSILDELEYIKDGLGQRTSLECRSVHLHSLKSLLHLIAARISRSKLCNNYELLLGCLTVFPSSKDPLLCFSQASILWILSCDESTPSSLFSLPVLKRLLDLIETGRLPASLEKDDDFRDLVEANKCVMDQLPHVCVKQWSSSHLAVAALSSIARFHPECRDIIGQAGAVPVVATQVALHLSILQSRLRGMANSTDREAGQCADKLSSPELLDLADTLIDYLNLLERVTVDCKENTRPLVEGERPLTEQLTSFLGSALLHTLPHLEGLAKNESRPHDLFPEKEAESLFEVQSRTRRQRKPISTSDLIATERGEREEDEEQQARTCRRDLLSSVSPRRPGWRVAADRETVKKDSQSSSAVEVWMECTLATLRVLMNATNENSLGCALSSASGAPAVCLKLLVFCRRANSLLLKDCFDVVVLSIGLLVNLLEWSLPTRHTVRSLEVLWCGRKRTGIDFVYDYFEDCLKETPQTAEMELENTVQVAYLALLLGVLVRDCPPNRKLILDRLPSESLHPLISVLDDFMSFQADHLDLSESTLTAYQRLVEELKAFQED
eukprot:Rmarinus@m.7481